MEKDYEKIEKLVRLRHDYASRLSPVDKDIEQQQKSMDQDEQESMASEWLSRRLDAGLFSLQVFQFGGAAASGKPQENDVIM